MPNADHLDIRVLAGTAVNVILVHQLLEHGLGAMAFRQGHSGDGVGKMGRIGIEPHANLEHTLAAVLADALVTSVERLRAFRDHLL